VLESNSLDHNSSNGTPRALAYAPTARHPLKTPAGGVLHALQLRSTHRSRVMMKAYWYIKNLFTRDEEGATMVEYGLLVALIAVACITAVALLGTDIAAIFNSVAGKVAAKTP
jgi:pilus assembly protein Flp/PilA